MKKRIVIALMTAMLGIGCMMPLSVEAAGSVKDSQINMVTEDMGALLKNLDSKEVQKLFDFLEKEIEKGSWDTKEGIDEALTRGEKEFGITLTREQREKIQNVVEKVKSLKLAPEFILEQAKKIYAKYGEELTKDAAVAGEEIIKETKEQIRQEVNKSVKQYFTDMVGRVTSFFKGLFKK